MSCKAMSDDSFDTIVVTVEMIEVSESLDTGKTKIAFLFFFSFHKWFNIGLLPGIDITDY